MLLLYPLEDNLSLCSYTNRNLLDTDIYFRQLSQFVIVINGVASQIHQKEDENGYH